MKERTLCIIKPDAFSRDLAQDINNMIENAGLKIIAQKTLLINLKMGAKFYEIHKDRPFFNELISYMSSGEALVQVLEGDNAVAEYRNLMGATNPKEAAEGTIRHKYALDIEKNSVHGSDSMENAIKEIQFFFATYEVENL